jgi:ribonucleotide monophosphatase NagD (HAD superfamily)
MLLLLDCDGTLETGQPPGPVKLEQLSFLMSRGFVAVIVSESGNCANLPLPRVVVPGNRLQALVSARLRYPNHKCIYISDNPGDDINAQRAGCDYLHPSKWNEFYEQVVKSF